MSTPSLSSLRALSCSGHENDSPALRFSSRGTLLSVRLVAHMLCFAVWLGVFLFPGSGQARPKSFDFTGRSVAVALLEEGVDKVPAARLREIIAQDGRFAFDRINLVMALIKDQAPGQLILDQLLEASRIDSTYPELPYLKGLALYRLGKYPESLAALSEAIRLNPRCQEAHFHMGLIHQMGLLDLKEAKPCFWRVVEPDPEGSRRAPLFWARATYLGYRHLAQIAAMERNEAEENRLLSLAEEYVLPGVHAKDIHDVDLALGPCALPVEPLDPKALAELRRAGVTLPAPCVTPSLEMVRTAWPGPGGRTPTSLMALDWTTSGLTVLWAGNRTLRKERERWVPGPFLGPGAPILASDLNGDGRAEVLVRTPSETLEVRSLPVTSSQPVVLSRVDKVTAALTFDQDADGDLDLVLAGTHGGRLGLWVFQNKTLPQKSTPVLALLSSEQASLSTPTSSPVVGLASGDADEANDLDVLAFSKGSSPILFLSRRHGRFDRVRLFGPPGTGPGVLTDLNGDGLLDVAYPTAKGLAVLTGRGNGTFEPVRRFLENLEFVDVQAEDLDGDMRADLLAQDSKGGLHLLLAHTDAGFLEKRFPGLPAVPARPLVVDLDGDGGIDIALPADGVLSNRSAQKACFLHLTLKGAGEKSHILGVGSKVKVRVGTRINRREVEHAGELFSLGGCLQADAIRVQWTNGTIQNHVVVLPDGGKTTAVGCRDTLTVNQTAGPGGSCPYLYVDRGQGLEFVTDVLCGSPLGLPNSDGNLAPTCPNELVALPRNSWAPVRGRYRMRVTEEYREVTYLDLARLWVVDHDPEQTLLPDSGMGTPPGEPKLLSFDELKSPLKATCSDGRNVTLMVAQTDGHYFRPPRAAIQGVSPEHFVEIALPPVPQGKRTFLILEGFVYWTDAGINTRLAQADPKAISPLRFDIPGPGGTWQTALPFVRFPAGRPKTAVTELTGLVPSEDRRVRLVSRMMVYLDRIAVGTMSGNETPAPLVRKLGVSEAALVFHGIAPMGPDLDSPPWFLVSNQRLDSLDCSWLIPKGYYTRPGPVEPLVQDFDDRYVVIGPGDGVDLSFPVVVGPRPGCVRDLFLETAGYDKDAHPATFFSDRVEPLPYRGMPPYRPGVEFQRPFSNA